MTATANPTGNDIETPDTTVGDTTDDMIGATTDDMIDDTAPNPGTGADTGGLKALLRPRRRPLILLACTAGFGGVLEAVVLVILTKAAFAITDGEDTVSIIGSLSLGVGATFGVTLGLLLATLLAQLSAAWQSSGLGAQVIADVRLDLSQAFLEASWADQHGERSGRLQELLTTFIRGGAQLINAVTLGVIAGINLVAMIVAAAFVDLVASAVLLVVIVLLAALVRPMRRLVNDEAERTAEAGMDFATSLGEVSQLGLEIQVFHVQSHAQRMLAALIRRNQHTNQRLEFWYQFIPTTYGSMSYLALMAALGVVAFFGTTELTAIGAVTLLMFRAIRYGQGVQSNLTQVTANLPFLHELDSELDKYRSGRVIDHGQPIGTVGALELHDVSFAYRDGHPVLRNLDAKIGPREIIGVIGPSGSGKSTLVQLLLGLRTPTTGTVTASDRPIGLLSRAEWARKVTFVPQQSHLIAGTVADNIRFFRDDVSDEQIERASRLANLHDDVVHWPEGYDRQVGEQGSHLSGGQQQRLIIARALVENPEVFILDEPTSALDVRSERLIRNALDELREHMIIIIIAHRLSTLDICNRIMVLVDGELVGFDSPEGLELTNEFYKEALVISGMRPG